MNPTEAEIMKIAEDLQKVPKDSPDFPARRAAAIRQMLDVCKSEPEPEPKPSALSRLKKFLRL